MYFFLDNHYCTRSNYSKFYIILLLQIVATHFGQCLKSGRRTRNAEDSFVIAVSDHIDTITDDNKPIVGHLPQEFVLC